MAFAAASAIATVYLLLKIVAAFIVGRHIEARYRFDVLSSLIAAWLILQIGQTGIILGLSALNALNQTNFLLVVGASCVIFIWRRGFPRSQWKGYGFAREQLPASIAIAAVLVLMWVRSLFLGDFTWDAQTYEIPRLAIWLNTASVFTHMPSLQLNLFVNEWNGEINCLAYALVSNSYQGFAFGNFEVLIWLFASVAWTARLLGASKFGAAVLAAVLCSTPAVIGLSSIVKGDLLAATAFLIAVGWLIKFQRTKSPEAICMLLLAATMAVGAKISVLLPVMVVITVAFLNSAGCSRLRDIAGLPKSVLAMFCFGVAVYASRFIANLFIYGNPLKRIDVERASFSVGHLISNLQLVDARLFRVWDEIQGQDAMWALSGSMGGGGWFIAAVTLPATCAFFWNRGKRVGIGRASTHESAGVSSAWLVCVFTAISVATLVSMTFVDTQPWVFRYFLPGILMLLIGIGVFAVNWGTTSLRRWIILGVGALAIAANVKIFLRNGEVIPAANVSILASEIYQANTPLKRITLFVRGPYQMAAVDALGLDSSASLRILAFQAVDMSILPFLGSRAQNEIRTVDGPDTFINAASNREWDVVAVMQRQGARSVQLRTALERQGYFVVVDNEHYLIALPLQPDDFRTLALQWQPWSSGGNTKFNFREAAPEITSLAPVDAGFISQEVRLEGPLVIKATFDGKITGSSDHAGHLSAHGQKLLVSLPSGNYTSSRQVQGLLSAADATALRHFSFGLGGWATGQGSLRLLKLEVARFQIQSRNAKAPASVSVSRPASVLVLALTLIVFGGCAVVGRGLLRVCGISTFSLLGGAGVFGYGLFGLLMLLSMKFMDTPVIGALGLLCGGMAAFARRTFRGSANFATWPREKIRAIKSRGRSGLIFDLSIVFIVATWGVAIAFVYFPLWGMAESTQYQLPPIFDLPKHLFAGLSLYNATHWPPPNPFFSGQDFAYTFVFYYPAVFVAKLIGYPLAFYQVFAISVLFVAITLPCTILDVVRTMTPSRPVQLGAVLVATWAGGLSPLWIHGEPALGFRLISEGLISSSVWVEEPFQYLLFVPQHVFASLCGVIAMLILVHTQFTRNGYRRVLAAGALIISGALASLILLPHLVISYAAGALIVVIMQLQTAREKKIQPMIRSGVAIAFLAPILVLIPFLIEILRWSSGSAPLVSFPVLSSQWWFVIAALGLVVPLALAGIVVLFRPCMAGQIDSNDLRATVFGMAALSIIGIGGILFGGYPDAGIKSGLWLRIVLIPLACAGLWVLFSKSIDGFFGAIRLLCICILFAAVIVLNVPTAHYFIRESRVHADAAIAKFVAAVRSLPPDSRMALFSSEQVLVAMTGRQIDFDFSSIRPDSYMSPDGRIPAQKFWAEFANNDPEIWTKIQARYDYIIAPTGSKADRRISQRYTKGLNVGGYSIYNTDSNFSRHAP